MLQLAQRTSAPSVVRVSMSTAVWIVMWSEPVTRAPARGLLSPYSARSAMSPGISCSARRDLLAAELGQGQVGDAEITGVGAWISSDSDSVVDMRRTDLNRGVYYLSTPQLMRPVLN